MSLDIHELGDAVQDATENLPQGQREEYLKKVFHSGQNKYRIVGKIRMLYLGFITDLEGKPKPVFTKGPKADGFLYKHNGALTGEPVDPLSRLCAKMRVSSDPKHAAYGSEWEPTPVYFANVIDLDNPSIHAESGKLALLCNSAKGMHFSPGIASDILQSLRNLGSETEPADYEKYNDGRGLLFITNKTGTGKGTRYSTQGVPAPAPMSDAERALVPYDLAKISSYTTMKQLREWLGDQIFQQYGISLSDLDEKDMWIPQRDKEGNLIPARKGPESGPADTNTAPPPGTSNQGPPAAPPPAAPPPAAPVAPPPPAGKTGPVINGQPTVLPSGWSWAPNTNNGNQPYYWKDSDPGGTVTNDFPKG